VEFGYKKLSANIFTIPLIIALVVCVQPIFMGYPMGHDWIFELVRIVEYHDALSSGQGLPFWGGNLYQGFGSPIFVFYAPLYVACTSLLMMAGIPVTVAAIAVLVFFTMLAAVGMTCLVREIIGRDKPKADAAAQVAAAVFVLAPYFLANMLIRNASAEFVALCLSPYPLWGLVLIYKGNHRGLPVLAVSFSLLILAHNLTGLTMAAVLSVVIFLQFYRKPVESFQAVIAILFALGLSCWFWLSALGLKAHVRIDEMTQGKFDFHNNFTPIGEMFNYGGLFAIGWLIPMLLLISVVALVRDRKNTALASLLAAGLVFVFLQTDMSTLIWENVPLLSLFQFPWRMLGPLSLVVALMSGLLFHKYLSHWRFSKSIIIMLVVANAIPLMLTYEPLSIEHQQFIAASLNPQGVSQQKLHATVLDEYLPSTANKLVSERVPAGIVILPRSIPAIVQWESNTNIYFEVETNRPGVLHVARWYFPGWRVTVDGVEQRVRINQYGAVQIDIPVGRHYVQLWLTQPALRQWGVWISAITVILFILFLLTGRRFWNVNKEV